jgi:hypothetical protein
MSASIWQTEWARFRVAAALIVLASFCVEQPGSAQFVQQGPKLVGPDAANAAAQGSSVGLSADGTTAIVGGPLDFSNQGAVWLYTRSGGVWSQQGGKLLGAGAVGAALQGLFGRSGWRR